MQREAASVRVELGVTATSRDQHQRASTTPLCGYQAGVQDFGSHDVITANHISGSGYLNHPTCTSAQPYVTYRIDTTGSLDPLVILNS